MKLCDLSNEMLLSNLSALLGSQREITAQLVAHLGEIEERRLHLIAGYSSMFDFCERNLRLSPGEAYRRILAARLGRRFPVIHALVASGAINLTALELLRERLTDENHQELLEAASGKTKSEIEVMLAARFPKPDVPSNIEKLPEQSGLGLGEASEHAGRASSAPSTRGRIAPLSESRYKFEFTGGEGLKQKLDRAIDLMSHANPSRELAPVVEQAIDLLLKELEKKKFGKTDRPRRGRADRKTKPGRVRNADKREVAGRDCEQCSYVSPDGTRCTARAFLEFDHVEPRGLGGGDGADNTRLLCQAHNKLWAEQTYGREYVERRIQSKEQQQRQRALADEIFEKVRSALANMGYRPGQARRKADAVRLNHFNDVELPVIQQLIVEALQSPVQ